MDIISYLLGKNASGGGGGTDLDWSALGYTERPPYIKKGYDYALTIKNNWDASQTNLTNKFSSDKNLMYMPLVDTSKATIMQGMFANCTILQYVPTLDTSNVTNMRSMFSECNSIIYLDLSGFNTDNLTEMRTMFNNCNNLKELNLSSFNTSQVKNMSSLFAGCRSLELLDIRNFDFSNVTNSSGMFNYVPDNCLIIVKDQTSKDWITNKFTNLTNVKIVSEL
jgi:surface protein